MQVAKNDGTYLWSSANHLAKWKIRKRFRRMETGRDHIRFDPFMLQSTWHSNFPFLWSMVFIYLRYVVLSTTNAKAIFRFVVSARPSIHLSAGNNLASTGQIFMKFYIWSFFENLSRKLNFHSNVTRMTDISREDLFIISRWIILKMRNVSDKSCGENHNTHFMCNTFFLYRAVYNIMWKKVEPERPQMRI